MNFPITSADRGTAMDQIEPQMHDVKPHWIQIFGIELKFASKVPVVPKQLPKIITNVKHYDLHMKLNITIGKAELLVAHSHSFSYKHDC